jgi:hypothetical protein
MSRNSPKHNKRNLDQPSKASAPAKNGVPPPQTPGGYGAYVELPEGEVGLLLDTGLGRKQVRAATAALFCPLCLKEAAYHRLIWLPFAVSACLAHHCLLLDHCPACRRTVSVCTPAAGTARLI